MDAQQKNQLLGNAKDWFRDELATSHIRNTQKLGKLSAFNVNPFTWRYLANFLEGNGSSEALAKALIYPRVLGTSISTSFGTQAQSMITRIFDGVLGSQIDGMDLEFIDQLDGRKKYCQLKAGPNILNKEDVPVIKQKFQKAKNLARQNHLHTQVDDYVFGLLYGEPKEANQFIASIGEDYSTYIGREFWYHLTGDEEFYVHLIESIGDIANEFDGTSALKKAIAELAEDIERHDIE